jgi:hypothetical protein
MARETATRRDEALRTVERAADFYGIPTGGYLAEDAARVYARRVTR